MIDAPDYQHSSQQALDSTQSPGNYLPWYALRVQSKCEKSVSSALQGKGYEQFLPLYRVRRQWSDRAKEMDLPLFAGYVFCRLDVRDRLLPILTTPGVISIVGAGKTPIAIDDDEIAVIERITRSGLLAQPSAFLPVGSRVYIGQGPLVGIEGTVAASEDNKCQLVISFSLLQRSVAVKIDRDWVCPIEEKIVSGRRFQPNGARRQ